MTNEYFKLLADIPAKEIFPGFLGRMIHTQHLTISYWDVTAGSEVPLHHHIHEQMATVLEGEFELEVNGISQVLIPGMVAVIASNIPHRGVAITNCKLMDIFTPVREDYKIR
jgi:quercetin dioxygenase-like cupin family protein